MLETRVKNKGGTISEERHAEFIDLALSSGATDAKLISAKDIIVDPRVRFKCMIPPCTMSGICNHCPPNGYSIEQVRKTISLYNNAIFFRVPVSNKIIASPNIPEAQFEDKMDNDSFLGILGFSYLIVAQIVLLLENKAREWDYQPTGFTAGDCKEVLCYFHKSCMALLSKKKGCRHPDIARPSMESCGMDVFVMAANAGWDVYPIGGTCKPGDVPGGSLIGLVLLDSKGGKRLKASETDDLFLSSNITKIESAERADPPFKNIFHKMKRYREKNISLFNMMIIAIWKEGRQFRQILKNFRKIEGSWMGAIKKMQDIQYL